MKSAINTTVSYD